jgi:hypothetical protein
MAYFHRSVYLHPHRSSAPQMLVFNRFTSNTFAAPRTPYTRHIFVLKHALAPFQPAEALSVCHCPCPCPCPCLGICLGVCLCLCACAGVLSVCKCLSRVLSVCKCTGMHVLESKQKSSSTHGSMPFALVPTRLFASSMHARMHDTRAQAQSVKHACTHTHTYMASRVSSFR